MSSLRQLICSSKIIASSYTASGHLFKTNFINHINHQPVRHLAALKPIYDYSLLDKNDKTICLAREKFGLKKLPKYILRKSSIFLYESCTDRIPVGNFIKHLELDDTFTGWFCVTRLHIWLLSTRCMKDKNNGECLRNELIHRMWEDCTNRMNKLGAIKMKQKKTALQNYSAEFNATLFGLDEGLVKNDVDLAGALWRNIFGMNKDPNPVILELTVAYTRAQLHHLNRIKIDQLLFDGNFDWASFPPLID